jgi:hypothetical protein
MEFPPLTRVDAAAFADGLFLVGQAWVKRALGDDQGAVEYLADAMVVVPDGTVEMILSIIEDGVLPEPVPGAMDPWLECCRQAGAGELRLTGARIPSTPAVRAPSRVTPGPRRIPHLTRRTWARHRAAGRRARTGTRFTVRIFAGYGSSSVLRSYASGMAASHRRRRGRIHGQGIPRLRSTSRRGGASVSYGSGAGRNAGLR